MFLFCTFIIIVLIGLHISFLKKKYGEVLAWREDEKDALKSDYFEEMISLVMKIRENVFIWILMINEK